MDDQAPLHALLTENFYRLVAWMMAHVRLKKSPNGPPLPVPPISLPSSALAGTLQIFHNRNPELKTFDYRYSLTLSSGEVYRVFFARHLDSFVVSGADCSDRVMLRDKPEDEFGGWFPEELAHGAETVNSGVNPDRILLVKNLIEKVEI